MEFTNFELSINGNRCKFGRRTIEVEDILAVGCVVVSALISIGFILGSLNTFGGGVIIIGLLSSSAIIKIMKTRKKRCITNECYST